VRTAGTIMKIRGFTLIELIVVIAVITVLMAVMVPVLSQAREQGRSTVCLNNLRQMAIAAEVYASGNDGSYPPAYYNQMDEEQFVSWCWDFTTVRRWDDDGVVTEVRPGLLWGSTGAERVHQCPSFRGDDNWFADPYTGYNYNTSYIGCDAREYPPASAKVTEVANPAGTALFGDGQWSQGANKFMRAPWSNPREAGFSGRYAGTQGYRHLGRTNVAFCDGHAEPWKERHTETYEYERANIAEGTGFLSADNSLYDLQ